MAAAVQAPLSFSATSDAAAIRAMVEAASLAMVREFLAKRRYKKTLDTLSTELPEPPQPTTSSAVAKQLGLLKLHQSNTKCDQPYPTLLEALAHSLVLKMQSKTPDDPITAPTAHTASVSAPTAQAAAKLTAGPGRTAAFAAPSAASATGAVDAATAFVAAVPQAKTAFTVASSAKPAATAAVSSNTLTSAAFTPASLALMSRMKQSAPPASNAAAASSKPAAHMDEEKQQSPAARRVYRAEDSAELLMEEFDDSDTTAKSAPTSRITAARTLSTHNPTTNRTILTPATTTAPPATALFASPPATTAQPTPIRQSEAAHLRTLTFGPSSPTNAQSFSQSWKQQGFYYTMHAALPYGLVQRDGGPCGLIAAVQAEVLRELLWSDWRAVVGVREVSEADQQRALVHALAAMLWRAGGGKQAKLAVEGGKNSGGGSGGGVKGYKPDGITECLLVHTATSYPALCSLLYHHLALYLHPHSHGLVLALYSLCLSRGLAQLASDFDYDGCALIGQHAYCTQELVNLCMTGQAVSNVFDGCKSMDGMVMKGIGGGAGSGPGTGSAGAGAGVGVGFVSLFEHYGYVEVGSVLKNPKYPVWIVCSESHYSVLYCEDKQPVLDHSAGSGGAGAGGAGTFDLFYYDELIKQQEVIRLTVDCSQKSEAPRSKELEPPLNDCIRTRWGKHARVSWNGTEPIL